MAKLPKAKHVILILMSTSTKLSASQKGLAPILIVLILAATLVGGYFIYQRQAVPKPYHPAPTAAPEIKPSPTSDETVNWKTYTNSMYGFAFQYPPNLMPNEDRSMSKDKPLVDFYDESGSAPHLEWNLYVDKKAIDIILSDILKKQNSNDPTQYKYQVIGQESFVIDDQHRGYAIKTKGQGKENYIIIIPINSSATVIFQSLGFDASTFSQILSTFKFTQ